MTPSVCGSGFAIISPERLGCLAARNKRDTGCAIGSPFAREVLDARVLNALTEHLTEPELLRLVQEGYTAETDRLRVTSGGARATKEPELQEVEREHGKLVDAVLAGVPCEQIEGDPIALEDRRQWLEAEFPASAPVQRCGCT